MLATQLPAIQHRTTDVITPVAEWAAGGNVIRIQQAIRAKQDRRQWIDENLIQPCQAAGVRVDLKHVIEHARLGEEIDNLTRELGGLAAQTEALNRATDLLRALGGNLQEAIPLLNAHGQGVVYGALVTAAYLAGTGRTHAKVHAVRCLTTVAETRIYEHNDYSQQERKGTLVQRLPDQRARRDAEGLVRESRVAGRARG